MIASPIVTVKYDGSRKFAVNHARLTKRDQIRSASATASLARSALRIRLKCALS